LWRGHEQLQKLKENIRRFNVRLTVFILLLLGLFAINSATAAELRVAVVDLQRVMEESPQAENAKKVIEKEFGPREKELIAAQKEVQKLDERMTRDGSMMSESERAKLDREILAKKRDFQRSQETFRDDLAYKQKEFVEKIQRDIVTHVRKYAADKKYDLVLANGVVYANDKIDITDEVLGLLKPKAGK